MKSQGKTLHLYLFYQTTDKKEEKYDFFHILFEISLIVYDAFLSSYIQYHFFLHVSHKLLQFLSLM